ncbi:hypothetical protein ABPG75_001503 [Micractinium tetrahymenae]
MGQCFSSQAGDAGQQWQVSGLAPFDAGARQYGGLEGVKPAGGYTTTADVGLKPVAREDKPAFVFMHDKPAPAPLQLERIEEDATLRGGLGGTCSAHDLSPVKQGGMPALEGSGNSVAGGGGGGAPHVQRKPISWTKGELVGQGAFGSVFVAMDNDTGELIAVKQVHVPRGGGAHAKKVEENIRSVEEEVQLLQQFDHPNIVRYLGTEKTEESLNIFLEYVPGGSIASLLAKFGSFKESVIRVYTKQILLGLEYLHSKGVMHRDIKGANILVDNTGLVKLADFGASKKLEDLVTVADGNKSVRGTPYWMAPEVITQTGHGRQADLWSVACTVLEMATGRPPWSTQYPSQVAAMFHIASSKGPPEIPQHLSPECKDFLYLCFNRDWKARPMAPTLLRHPFLADVPVRSHGGGPSPNAAVLAQAWRAPRNASGVPAAAAPEPSDSQFGTPSPLNPKLAGMPGGAARISLQTTEGGAPGDSSAALSPLGQHAASRRPQWDSAAALVPPQQQQAAAAAPLAPPAAQLQQQQQSALSREFSAAARLGGSPTKRPAMSLRASAPVFSGYASVALSQQSEPLAPRLGRPPAAGAAAEEVQQQPAGVGALRGSRESAVSGAASSAATGVSDSASQRQQSELRRSGSGPHPEREASSHAAVPAAPATEVPAQQTEQPAAAPEQPEEQRVAGPAASETPAALRQRPGVQDLLQPEAQPAGPAGPMPASAGNSSGTNKSDYNPMEEPSWLHPHESPLLGDGTPTSALTGASPPQRAPAAASSSLEASSFAAAGAAPAEGAAAAAAGVPPLPAAAQQGTATGPAGYDQHPSADHMVWTNEDGDIDALPWDMGGWSTGSSAERAGGEQQQEQQLPALQPQQQNQQQRKLPADAVDEDALIGALRRKAQHDVRASMALFEKSLNIPELSAPPSPKSAAAAAAAGSCSPRTTPRTIAAVHTIPQAPVAAPAQSLPAIAPQPHPAAESIESLGAPQQHGFPLQPAPAAAAAAAAGDDSRRRAAAVQHLLSGARPTATGVPPPPSPLQAAVGGLAELGYGGAAGGMASAPGRAAGGDREAIWQQELSQELHRVKTSSAAAASGGGVPNRRMSMHGSPLKSRLHA